MATHKYKRAKDILREYFSTFGVKISLKHRPKKKVPSEYEITANNGAIPEAFMLSNPPVRVVREDGNGLPIVIAGDIKELSSHVKDAYNSDNVKQEFLAENDECFLSVAFNDAKNGIELSFDGKPDDSILERVKAAKFRWSRRQKVWYARQTESTVEFAEKLLDEICEDGEIAEVSARVGEPQRVNYNSYSLSMKLAVRKAVIELLFQQKDAEVSVIKILDKDGELGVYSYEVNNGKHQVDGFIFSETAYFFSKSGKEKEVTDQDGGLSNADSRLFKSLPKNAKFLFDVYIPRHAQGNYFQRKLAPDALQGAKEISFNPLTFKVPFSKPHYDLLKESPRLNKKTFLREILLGKMEMRQYQRFDGMTDSWESVKDEYSLALNNWMYEWNHPLTYSSLFYHNSLRYSSGEIKVGNFAFRYSDKPSRNALPDLELEKIASSISRKFYGTIFHKGVFEKFPSKEDDPLYYQHVIDRLRWYGVDVYEEGGKMKIKPLGLKVKPLDDNARKAVASLLREKATSLNKQIEEKLNPATASQNPTARRAGIIASMRQDGEVLLDVQAKMFALANAWEANKVPPILSAIRNKIDVITVRRGFFPNPEKGMREDLWKDLSRFQKLGIYNEAKALEAKAALNNLATYEKSEEELKKEAIDKAEAQLLGVKVEGFFPTPKPIAKQAVELLEIDGQMTVLEPSAGKGDLAEALQSMHPNAKISVIEKWSKARDILALKGFNVVGHDALSHFEKYDRVLMNPPFEKKQDIIHVMHAFKHNLKPNGRLVAIMGEGAFFRNHKLDADFRDFFEQHGVYNESFKDAFKGAGSFRQTGVASRLVVLEKPSMVVYEPEKEVTRNVNIDMQNDTDTLVSNAVPEDIKEAYKKVRQYFSAYGVEIEDAQPAVIGNWDKILICPKDGHKLNDEVYLLRFPKSIATIRDGCIIASAINELGVMLNEEAEQKIRENVTADFYAETPDFEGMIDYEMARRAFMGTSFSPEKRAESRIKGFAHEMGELWQIAKKLSVPSAEWRRAEEKARQLYTSYLSNRSGLMSAAITGPARFPVRKQEAKWQRNFDMQSEYVDFLNKVARKWSREYGNSTKPIKVGESGAVEKLKIKLAKQQEFHEKMKALNKVIRNKKLSQEEKKQKIKEVGNFSDTQIDEILAPDYLGRIGFQQFELSNSLARIKRLKEQVAKAEKAESATTQIMEFEGGEAVENREANRFQLFFEDKPDEATRTWLKKNGFRWSRKNGAWQSYLDGDPHFKAKLHFKIEESSGGSQEEPETEELIVATSDNLENEEKEKAFSMPKENTPEKEASTLPALGKEIVIKLPNGEKRKGQFAIVELANIVASHNEKTFASSKGYPTNNSGHNINDRNYADDVQAQAKVKEIAQKLEPSEVITNSRGVNGTPIITKDNIVVSGNNRTMSLKLAQSDYPANFQEYQNFLKDEIEAYGFEGMKYNPFTDRWEVETVGTDHVFVSPILVRVDYDFPAYTTTELSKYNRSEMKSERPVDKAIRLSNTLREQFRCHNNISEEIGRFDTLSDFYRSRRAEQDVLAYLKACSVITENDVAGIFEAESGFNAAGKELLESVLSAVVLEKDALLAVNMDGVKRFRQLIVSVLPVLAKHASLSKNFIDALNEAVVLQKKIQSSGLTFREYISQIDMFEAKPSRNAMIINRLMASGRKTFKEAFHKYNESFELNQTPGLFNDQKQPEEIFEFYFEKKIDEGDLSAIDRTVNYKGAKDKENERERYKIKMQLEAEAKLALLRLIEV